MSKTKKLKDICYWLMILSGGVKFACRLYSWVILDKIFLILFIIFAIIFVALYCYIRHL